MNTLRDTEIQVIKALANHHNVAWRSGEDPPDAYLTWPSGAETAVEITSLAQWNADGTRERLSDDMPGLSVARYLNERLAGKVLPERLFIVGFPSPTKGVRKTQARLLDELIKIIRTTNDSVIERTFDIGGNIIDVAFSVAGVPSSQNVFGYIRPSGAHDTLAVTLEMLNRALADKSQKCRDILLLRPMWLLLRSDYFFAEKNVLDLAMKFTATPNPFEKIYFFDSAGSIHELGVSS